MESDRKPCPAYLEAMEIEKNLPDALRPVYTTEKPNEPILLYEGEFEISEESKHSEIKIKGNGNIKYVWFPYPCIKFQFSALSKSMSAESYNLLFNSLSNSSPISLILCKTGVSVEASIENTSLGGDRESSVSGRINQPFIRGMEQNLGYIMFHVANFHSITGNQATKLKADSGGFSIRPNRIVFDLENWKITFEQLETAEETIKQLKNQGGFGITHIGKLERVNGHSFSGNEAQEFLEIFSNFLSFARGFSVPLVLLVGYDPQGNRIWEYSDSSAGDSWKNVSSWCPKDYAGKLVEIFPGFLSWWQTWEESERVALYWYLEATYNPLTEQKIILIQVALELIAWVLLVEQKSIITATGFDKLPASGKIRLLLSQFGISLKIPPETSADLNQTSASQPIKDLVNLAKTNSWMDGLHAFTEIRNGIVHPEKKKREKIYKSPSDAKFDASELGMWYLELVFLAMFNYEGHYINRLLKNGCTELVPWSKKS